MGRSLGAPLARMRRRRAIRRDRRGVTDVPLELVIIMIILAIVVPIIIAAFYSYTRDQELMSLQEDANNVANTAVEVFDDGLNTTLLLTVNIPNSNSPILTVGAPLFANNVTGGTPNSNSTYIHYAISGYDPGPLTVTNGAGEIYLTGITCANSDSLGYQAVILTGGHTYQLSLVKLGPGAFYCSQAMGFSFVGVMVNS